MVKQKKKKPSQNLIGEKKSSISSLLKNKKASRLVASNLLELPQRPVVSSSIFEVLDLYSHYGTRERLEVTLLLWLGRQKLRGKWGVQCVRQKHKLELDL